MTYVSAPLKRQVIKRAGDCCEYCRMGQDDERFPYHIEHIIAVKHGGQSTLTNLGLSCLECNLNKGSDIASNDPITGDITRLYNPRLQNWDEHFRLNIKTAQIEPLTPEGRVTVFLLKMNSKEQIEYRQILIELETYPCASIE